MPDDSDELYPLTALDSPAEPGQLDAVGSSSEEERTGSVALIDGQRSLITAHELRVASGRSRGNERVVSRSTHDAAGGQTKDETPVSVWRESQERARKACGQEIANQLTGYAVRRR